MGVVILPKTQAAELTWDGLQITMGYVNGCNLWFRSGVMCACDYERLVGY